MSETERDIQQILEGNPTNGTLTNEARIANRTGLSMLRVRAAIKELRRQGHAITSAGNVRIYHPQKVPVNL